ncbi:MAG: hypothetical protein HY344_03900 [Candidatus Levybacteria bacterium]|nr:hypothetical protein [Candidatus Levybacteria bacterium]
MKAFLEPLVIIASFITVFIWQESPLKDYTVQLLGLFIVLYFIVSARKGGKGFLTLGGEGFMGVFILNTLIFLLIFSTGGLQSALFFVLYFLSFGIAFVFDPKNVFVFILGGILIFYPEIQMGDLTSNLLKIGSLALISPLAYFFGREYRRSDQQDEKVNALKDRTKEAADTISEDIEEVIEEEKGSLKEKDVEKLNEVLEETEDLRSESK